MQTYRYKALTADSVETAGVIDGTDFDDAIQRLLALGLREIQVFRLPQDAEQDADIMYEAEVVPVSLDEDEALTFSQQVAQVSLAEIPLSAGLRAAAEESSSPRIARALVWVAERVDQGQPLEEALTSSGRLLPAYFSGLILASARTGSLGGALFELVELQHKDSSLRREIMGIYVYPLIVISLCVAVSVGLGYYVAGMMQSFVEEFGLSLPFVTREFFWWRNTGFWILLVAALAIGLLALLFRVLGGAARWRRLMSTVPLFGSLWHWMGVSQWAGLMAILLRHRVPLPEALRWAGRGSSDPFVGQLSRRMADGVARGRTLGQMMYAVGYLPVSLIPVIDWGEKSGAAADAFRTGQEMLAERARRRATLLQSVIPPLLFLLVGSVLQFVLIAMFLPMINLISHLS